MKRFIILSCAFVTATCCAYVARADVTYEKSQEGDQQLEIVRLSVTPAPEPVPALRHRFVTRDVDLKSGNAVPYYYRAFMESRSTVKQMREKFDDEKQLGLWNTTGEDATPIAKLPLDKVREASRMFDSIYSNHLRSAFERSDCEWELGVEDIRGIDIISFLLPEFQDSREVARMMALRTRLAIAEHRYDDAIETMRHQYRLGSDVAKVPFLVCGLIGIAIDSIGNGTAVDLIANPDSPNLYWALTELPQPAIDLRRAARFEMGFGPRMFPFIDHADTAEHSPQEWNWLYTKALGDLTNVTGQLSIANQPDVSPQVKDTQVGLAATGLALLGYTHAKARLVAQGMDPQRVEQMSVGQVMAVYSERVYRKYSDEFEKSWYLPFTDMRFSGQELERRVIEAMPFGTGEDREVLPIVSFLLPAMYSARSAQVRLERDIAALRVIEALRMYAAEHNRQLPASLEDIKAVPVPLNPATAQPFVYHLNGGTAVLELPASDGIINGNRRYEIQIATDKK